MLESPRGDGACLDADVVAMFSIRLQTTAQWWHQQYVEDGPAEEVGDGGDWEEDEMDDQLEVFGQC